VTSKLNPQSGGRFRVKIMLHQKSEPQSDTIGRNEAPAATHLFAHAVFYILRLARLRIKRHADGYGAIKTDSPIKVN
jgi:hypothetical protein